MAQQRADAGLDDNWEAHWGSYTSSAVDNPAQAYRRRLTFKALSEDTEVARLLDIGSGQGDLLAAAARAWPHARLLGVELGRPVCARAGARYRMRSSSSAIFLKRTRFRKAKRIRATHAVCSEVLEHVDDPAAPATKRSAVHVPRVRGGHYHPRGTPIRLRPAHRSPTPFHQAGPNEGDNGSRLGGSRHPSSRVPDLQRLQIGRHGPRQTPDRRSVRRRRPAVSLAVSSWVPSDHCSG